MSAAARYHFSILVDSMGCRIFQNRRLLRFTTEQAGEGLYYICSSKPKPGAALAAAAVGVATPALSVQQRVQLWHRRLGHLGYSNLGRLVKGSMVQGIGVPADSFQQHAVSAPPEGGL